MDQYTKDIRIWEFWKQERQSGVRTMALNSRTPPAGPRLPAGRAGHRDGGVGLPGQPHHQPPPRPAARAPPESRANICRAAYQSCYSIGCCRWSRGRTSSRRVPFCCSVIEYPRHRFMRRVKRTASPVFAPGPARRAAVSFNGPFPRHPRRAGPPAARDAPRWPRSARGWSHAPTKPQRRLTVPGRATQRRCGPAVPLARRDGTDCPVFVRGGGAFSQYFC